MDLPSKPDYTTVCDIIDNQSDEYWLGAIGSITSRHQLPSNDWVRIHQGGNVLFRHEGFTLKLVPPNWDYQARAEIESLKILPRDLTKDTPELLFHGALDNWVYLIITWLPGLSLSEVWQELPVLNKKLIVRQVGEFARELHQTPVPVSSSLAVDWSDYQARLIAECVPRHRENGLPSVLLEQVPGYLNAAADYFDDGEQIFTHMDLHPWNLMVTEIDGSYQLSGILDFGDAIIGRSRLLELATPILFLCQGNKDLVRELLKSYQLFDASDKLKFQQDLMAVCLLRPACDLNFVFKQVPKTGPRDSWQQMASQLFPC